MNTSIVAGNFVPERIYFSSFFSSFFRLSNTINNETERGGLDWILYKKKIKIFNYQIRYTIYFAINN